MARRLERLSAIDTELSHLPAERRWREWMNRVEAVIFASATPVPRDMLTRIVGQDCNIDLIIEDIGEELRGRPYELIAVAGGWQHRTRLAYADVIRASSAPTKPPGNITQHEATVLMAIGYFQPVTRNDLSKIFGKEVGRDAIAALRQAGFVTSGPRSPTPGAPYTFVTTPHFLAAFGFASLRDLPDIEMLEDAGLLKKTISEEEGLGFQDDEDDE